MDTSPISTTRTTSPYFSPNMAIGALLLRFLDGQHLGHDGGCPRGSASFTKRVDRGELLGRDALEVREVKAQAVGLNQGAGLMNVVAQNRA